MQPLTKPTFTISTNIISRCITLNNIHCNPLLILSKNTLKILDPWDSHFSCAFRASLGSISATPYVCEAFSSSWPDYNSISAESSLFYPVWVWLVFLILRAIKLHLLISVAFWIALSVSHFVRIFHVPILIVPLVIRMNMGLVTSEESRLSTRRVTTQMNEDPSTPKIGNKWFKLLFWLTVS